MKKIAILWADPYNTNLGVSALAYSSLALIEDALKLKDLSVTFVGCKFTRRDKVLLGDNEYEFETLEGLDYFRVKSLLKMLFQYKKYKPHKLLGFDYIVDIGAGDSYADIYGLARFYRMYNSKRLFKVLRKKQLLLPQTIGPFKDKKIEKKAFDILKSFTYVFGRDQLSYNYANKFIRRDKLDESIDVAFYLPFKAYKFKEGKTHIGINVSGLLWNGGYTKNNQFNLTSNYQKLIRNTIEYFINEENCVVHLVGHVVPEYEHVENDFTVCELLNKEYNSTILAPRFKSPIEAKSYIAGLNFFTGARMHSTIAAFSAGVPVCPMAYSRKFNGLFVNTLQYDWLGDCVNDDTQKVFNDIVDAFNKRKELKERIQESHIEIITPRLNNLKEKLKDFVLS
ncbi:polysaccharide pyruvyl transferase family protein [Labilibacter sediminis]|nr:polysaccharide pyruvyl transferase family protein [Labilibacter sediminis]